MEKVEERCGFVAVLTTIAVYKHHWIELVESYLLILEQ
jgi:hypothetical protein